MRRKAWTPLLVFVSVLTAARGHADPLRLSIDDAVARARAASLDTSAARKDIDVARANLERSKVLLPSNPFVSGGAQSTSQTGVGSNYVFLLSQEFEVAGQRSKRIAAASHAVEKAVWEQQSGERDLVATVKTAFVQALIGADRIVLAQQSADAAGALLRDIDRRKISLETQRIEANAARIQESRARREVAAAEQARDSVLGTLRRLLDLPFDQEVEVIGAPQSRIRDLPATPQLVERALANRADLQALKHALQRSDQQLALAKREGIPNITLSGTASRFEGETLLGGDIGLPLPLFDRKTGDAHEAIAERERARLELRHLERLIAQEVAEARRACTVAAADLETSRRDIVPRSEENLRIEQRLYNRGDVGVADLIGIQIDAIVARREYLDALQGYNEYLIELERAVATDLDTNDAAAPAAVSGPAASAEPTPPAPRP